MKILCFGDSNTWGYKPGGGRYNKKERWTTIMGDILDEDYTIIEEGLCGRSIYGSDFQSDTTVDEKAPANSFLSKYIKDYYPFDMMIIMLGTNDLRPEIELTTKEIAQEISQFAKHVLNYNYEDGAVPKIIIVSPPYIKPGVSTSPTSHIFGLPEESAQRSRELAKHYKSCADELGVYFLDAAEYVEVSDIDSLHLDGDAHKIFAKEIATFIQSL